MNTCFGSVSRLHHLIFLIPLILAASTFAGTLDRPYIDPAYATTVPFGGRSQWIQPWRGYLETVPAETFVRAVGCNYAGWQSPRGEDPDLIVQMLANYGMTNARTEISWCQLNFDDDGKLNDADKIRDGLRRLSRAGLRPMILLNANSGIPCPCILFHRKVTADAKKGDTTVQLDDVSGLIIGRSGLSNLTDYWAAEALITKIDGNTVTLSKPLPKDIAAGTTPELATLKYRPFGPPDAAETAPTMLAWQHYVLTVARFAADALGTTDSADKGFDLEIWNELTFGTKFLSINNYYSQKVADYDWETLFPHIVTATAEVIRKNPTLFTGVKVCDGFSNTTPWPASSKEPPEVTALSHHPYGGPQSYPAEARHGDNYDALFHLEPGHALFEPTYTEWFTEYGATLLQTEHIIRDTSPITTLQYDVPHGRWARDPKHAGPPFETWFTETALDPADAHMTDRKAALDLKGKAASRTYLFWINKGVTKLQMFGACEGDLSLGIVQDNFIDYSKTHHDYPADDSQYVSPMLRTVGHIVAKMKQGMDSGLQQTIPIHVDSISDTHDHLQFAGDGTPTHPTMFNRDCLAILPFQVNDHRMIIAYYVITRDVRNRLPAEAYTVRLSGINANAAKITAYDPIHDVDVPVTVSDVRPGVLTLSLLATDYPYLLTIDGVARP